jgi:hypothetical protein
MRMERVTLTVLEVDGTGPGSCPVVGFGISGVEISMGRFNMSLETSL